MRMTFDATLKDMGRDSPHDFLAEFDQPSAVPVKLLNVDLSTVTTATDLVWGSAIRCRRSSTSNFSQMRRPGSTPT